MASAIRLQAPGKPNWKTPVVPKGLNRKKPMKRTRLARQSVKRGLEAIVYWRRRRLFLKENPICCFPEICPEWSTDVHHMAGRSGTNFLDESTWLSCCREHHQWIHAYPNQARRMGLLK